MIYTKEVIFIEKLLASLKLNECSNVDVSKENMSRFIPLLKKEIINQKLNIEINELNSLFLVDSYGNYVDIYKIIKTLDPLVGELNGDNLYIALDEATASIILHNNESDNFVSGLTKETMLEIGLNMKEYMKKKEKVKLYENYE